MGESESLSSSKRLNKLKLLSRPSIKLRPFRQGHPGARKDALLKGALTNFSPSEEKLREEVANEAQRKDPQASKL